MITMVYGTTAELIKLFPVILNFDRTELELICTGQQPEDLNKLHKRLEIYPDFQTRSEDAKSLVGVPQGLIWALGTTIKLLKYLTKKPKTLRSRVLVVHGDTTTAIVAAMAGRLVGFRVAHVEAGLRSKNLLSPFPEELNRRLVSKIARLHFAPSDDAVLNLARSKGKIIHTQGNTITDSLSMTEIQKPPFDLPDKYAVISLHRGELLGRQAVLERTLDEVVALSKQIMLVMVIDSLTQQALRKTMFEEKLHTDTIMIINKLAYPEFQYVLRNCQFLVTDSGGQQEEAAQLGLPCLIHRIETERSEGVGENAVLSGWEPGAIESFGSRFTSLWLERKKTDKSPSQIIAQELRLN